MLRFENVDFCFHVQNELVESQKQSIREIKEETIPEVHVKENIMCSRAMVPAVSRGI